jgi:hypothetical protein
MAQQTYPIDPSGAVSNRLFDELSDEARQYLKLVERLKTLPPEHLEREGLEDQLFSSLAHLAAHASASQSALMDVTEETQRSSLLPPSEVVMSS